MPRRAFPSLVTVLLPALLLAGCGEPAPVPEQPLTAAALEAVAEEPGTDREKLAEAVDALFTREGIGETRAVIVMLGGEIAAERYGEGYGPETRFVGWSMSKTVTGVLIGMMVADGRLRLDDSPPIPRWQRAGDPRGEITLRQLLQMRDRFARKAVVAREQHVELVHDRHDARQRRLRPQLAQPRQPRRPGPLHQARAPRRPPPRRAAQPPP